MEIKSQQNCSLIPYKRKEILSAQSLKQKTGWGISALNLPSAWQLTQGEGITLAVIDSGCDLDHDDLKNNLLPGINFIEPKKDPYDDAGHGCVSPDTFIHTNVGGIEHISSLYDRIIATEIVQEQSVIKDVRGHGITTYSLDKNSGEVKIGEIEFLHKTFIDSDVIEAKLDGNIRIDLTPWHQIYTKKRLRKDKYRISSKRADELEKGDGLIFPIGTVAGNLISEFVEVTGGEYKKCDRCQHVCRCFRNLKSPCKKCFSRHASIYKKKYLLNEDWCYFIGLILTDGHIIKNRNYRVEISSNTIELLENARSILTRCGFVSRIDYPKNKCPRLICDSKELVCILENAGIKIVRKSYEQDLPEFIGKSPKSAICAFIAGVIDGDGCVSINNKKNRITTISNKFVQQLTYLLNSISLSAGWQIYKNYAFSTNKKLNDLGSRKINHDLPIYNCTFSSVPDHIRKYLAHPVKLERSKIEPILKWSIRRIASISKKLYKGYYYDFTVKDYNTYIANGHMVSNTHVTGIICAENNNLGIVGVAPRSKVRPIKVLDQYGDGQVEDVVKGIRWAIKQKVDFIIMSLGTMKPMSSLRWAIKAANAKGIIVIVAAGNMGKSTNLLYPANYPEVISVGAIDKNMTRADFNNTGDSLDFMAPGVDILSTVPKNWYAIQSGSSMAGPFFGAMAALLLSYKRNIGLDVELNNCDDYRKFFKKYTTNVVGEDYAGDPFYQGLGIVTVPDYLKQSNVR